MTPRFQFDPPPQDSEIVRRASMLKLHFFREDDGELSGSFEIEGAFGNFSAESSQDGVDEGLRFVAELVRRFTHR